MYDVLSPDGFPIERESNYKTIQEAEVALDNFCKRFESQGYYSSNAGRIDLDLLKESCEIIKI